MASITLKQVSVSFPIYDQGRRSLKKRLLSGMTGGRIKLEADTGSASVVQALDRLDLVIGHGDRVGLVGHNGAGKTTLLRVLAGIYEPVSGSVEVTGSVAPLFDITLGMDPDSSGYENILLRGLFLGYSRKDVEERVDDIADFTGLGEFLDLPMRTYSAGMRMRLAFAVSTSIAPDILLLDEGIGAGDQAFLNRAKERLETFTAQAGIIVLASHSADLLLSMCQNAVLMERGRITAVGETREVLEIYERRLMGL
jgi:ABC-2 type transport system ATP-binding protein